jgi:hypothetical protein
MTKLYYLYKIENLLNGKTYIGITSNPKSREYQHLRKPKIESPLLSLAVGKYGKDSFNFEILVCGTKGYIADLETKAIDLYNSITPNGYNIKPGGETGLGGYKIDKRKDDKSVYVSGFWFNSIRLASEKLGISKSTLHKRKANGAIGDIVKPEIIKKRVDDKPIYVSGFWFPATRYAKFVLCKDGESIRRNGLIGRILPKFGAPEYKENRRKGMLGLNSGPSNGMFGKRNTSRSRVVLVEGVRYPSISEAVRKTDYTKSQIEKRLKKGHPDFKYTQEP